MDGSQTSFSFQGLTNKSSQTILNPHLLKCTALKVCFTHGLLVFPFLRIFFQVGLRRKFQAGSDLRHRSPPGTSGAWTEAGGQNIRHRGRDPRVGWHWHCGQAGAGIYQGSLGQRDRHPRQDGHPQLQGHWGREQVRTNDPIYFPFLLQMSPLIFKSFPFTIPVWF